MKNHARPDHNAQQTKLRLFQALSEMAEQDLAFTASALCVRAGISRTSLYKYHPDVVGLLNALKNRSKGESNLDNAKFVALQAEKDSLTIQISQIAAVVDHYYAAWKEVSGLLKRREGELVSLRRATSTQLSTVPK